MKNEKIFKRIAALLMSVVMIFGVLPITVFAGPGGGNHRPTGPRPGDDTLSGGSSTSVDHIDINVSLEAEVTVNGESQNIEFTLTEADVKGLDIVAKDASGNSVSFTRGDLGTSTDSDGNAQIRIEGDFPVGTKSEPVSYTVTLKKTVSIAMNGDKISVPVVLTVTTNYWDENNACPGLGTDNSNWQNGSVVGGSGIDLKLGGGEGSADTGFITVQKTIVGASLDADKTFTFNIYADAAKTQLKSTVDVTVPAGSVTASNVVANLPFGTYYVYEVMGENNADVAIGNYNYVSTEYSTANGSVTLDSDSASETINVTNVYSLIPASVTVNKIWNDNANTEGLRPSAITVYLFADGEKIDEATLTANNGWTYYWSDLAMYNADGDIIVYTVKEADVENYRSSIIPNEGGFVIKNTLIGTSEYIIVNGEKYWNDNNNGLGVRPGSIKLDVYVDGEYLETITVTSADKKADNSNVWEFSFILEDYMNEDGSAKKIEIREKNVPNYVSSVVAPVFTFTYPSAKDWNIITPCNKLVFDDIDSTLVAIKPTGGEDTIVWTKYPLTASEQALVSKSLPSQFKKTAIFIYGTDNANITAEYGITVDGNTVNFEGTSRWSMFGSGVYSRGSVDATTAVVTNTVKTIDIDVEKIWNDNNNSDGKRPASITVELLANGTVADTITVTAADGWKGTFEGLVEYDKDGNKITYTVREGNVDEYESSVSGNAEEGFTIKNSYDYETVVVAGQKTWVDANDQDGIRPESITINLLANGEVIATVEVTEADGWAWTFEGLAKYEAGVEIEYTITEEAVEGYTSVVNGYNVTNTHVPATVEVSGSKTWVDANDQDGIRPESITVNLLANGEIVETITVTEADGWAWTFEGLAKYEAGV